MYVHYGIFLSYFKETVLEKKIKFLRIFNLGYLRILFFCVLLYIFLSPVNFFFFSPTVTKSFYLFLSKELGLWKLRGSY